MDIKRLLTICLGSFALTISAQTTMFKYQNPITSGIDTLGIRDCHVFQDNGVWYMTGTAYPFWVSHTFKYVKALYLSRILEFKNKNGTSVNSYVRKNRQNTTSGFLPVFFFN